MLIKYGKINKYPIDKFYPQPRNHEEIDKICDNKKIELPKKILQFQIDFGGLFYTTKKLPTRGLDCGLFINEKARYVIKKIENLDFNFVDTKRFGTIYIIADYNVSAPEWIGMNSDGKVFFGEDIIIAEDFKTLIENDALHLNLITKHKLCKRFIIWFSDNEKSQLVDDIFNNYSIKKFIKIDSLNMCLVSDEITFFICPNFGYENYSNLEILCKNKKILRKAINNFGKYNYEQE